MNEVEVVARAEAAQIRRERLNRRLGLKCDEAFQPEDGVIQVRIAGAILKATIRMPLFEQKMLDESARVTELLRRQPRDLQHFEPQTHDTIL